jgi:RNA polymerase sigma-70 factor (ECF subfamily)
MLEESRERQLVEEARKGDRAALEALFADARERLLGAVRARLGPAVRQAVDPEDVLQDTFTRALGAAERFEWQGQGSFCRWLESIATHIVLDAVRRQGHRKVLQIEGDVRGDAASPSKHMRRKERLERLRRSLGALSPEHQSVLRLSRMEGLSIKEIAERLGRSESAVKNLLLRATKQLKAVFGDTESLSLEGPQLEETGEPHGR